MKGCLFMSNDKSLVSFALISTEYINNRKDYYDMLLPFILTVIKESGVKPGEEIDTAQLCNQLTEDFGFSLWYNVVEAMLRRLTNDKYDYLRIQSGHFYRTSKEIDICKFSSKRSEIECHQEKVFNSLFTFLERTDFEYDVNVMRERMIIYLSRYGLDVLNEQEAELVLNDQNDIYTHYIGKFISYVKENLPEIFNYVKEIVKGAMLASVVCLQIDSDSITESEDFKNLKIFLDTTMLYNLLGNASKAISDATRELVDTLYQLGAELYYFPHTKWELKGILGAYVEKWMNNDLDNSYNFDALIENKVNAQIILEQKILLSDFLNRYHVKEYPIKEIEAFKYKDELTDCFTDAKLCYKSKESMENDMRSVSEVYSLRTLNTSKRLEECECILLTTNTRLRYVVNDYFKKSGLRDDYAAVIDDTYLSSLVWLKVAKSSDTIPEMKVIADAYASQELPRTFWDDFVKCVNRLRESEKITDYDMYVLKYDAFARNHIYEVAQGDTTKITFTSIENVLKDTDEVKYKEILELNSKKEKELQSKEEELRSKTQLIRLKDKELQSKDEELQSKNEEIAMLKFHEYTSRRVCLWKLLYYVYEQRLFITCVLICIVASALSVIFKRLGILIPGISVVFTVCSLIFQKYFDKLLSQHAPQFLIVFLKKSYVSFVNSISEKDTLYKDRIITIANKSKYFSSLPTDFILLVSVSIPQFPPNNPNQEPGV